MLGAVVSMYTLTLLLSQVDRRVFTSRRSSLSTNCCALQPWHHKGSTLIKNSIVFMSCYLQKTSTSQLYAHLFVNMCKIYWMLNALYEDLFKSYVKIMSCICFSKHIAVSLWTGPASADLSCSPCIFKCGVTSLLSFQLSLKCHESFCTFVDSPEPPGEAL